MTSEQIYKKRFFDAAIACIGIMVFSLPFCCVAFLVKLTSAGSIFFRQQRVGRHGKLFQCIKFRTMYIGSEKFGSITAAQDVRITPLGRILRKYKIDELPQLWNVLVGDMSFVGPRPDVPGYADSLTGESRKILELYPGITGPASLYFKNEEEILAKVPDPKIFNDKIIFPIKIRLNLKYYEEWSLLKDVNYIIKTVFPFATSSLQINEGTGLNAEDIIEN